MQSVRWIGFCVAQTMSRSVLHFFPSSDNASAPYAASCTLTLFGPQGLRSSVVLEGGRLGHPDGLRLEDAFPVLRGEISGIFGLEVEISTPQPRLDVRSSGCVVEIVSQGLPVRFAPKKLVKAEVSETIRQLRAKTAERSLAAKVEKAGVETVPGGGNAKVDHNLLGTDSSIAGSSGAAMSRSDTGVRSGLAVRDGQYVPSIMVVNGSTEPCVAFVHGISAGVPKPPVRLPLTKVELAPGASQELPLDESLFRAGRVDDVSVGACSALPVVVDVVRTGSGATMEQREGTPPADVLPEVAAFMVYREATTRRMSSVTTLG